MLMTREEFDTLIRKSKERYSISWDTGRNKQNGTDFPVITSSVMGRCRYCGKKTRCMFMYFDHNQSVIMDVVSRLMRKSNNICDLNCLYNFIIDRTPEILEEITR